MFDYNIEDARRILKSFDSVDLRLDNHILDNWFEREINLDYILDCLKDKMILSISKTSENRFKLIYPHEKLKTKDLYIIIEIDDFEKITVKTVYSLINLGGNAKMRENDSQEVIYRYDHLSDTLGIKVTRNFKYDETIEMDDGILLDFDADGIPVSLEILDASKRFDLDAGSFKKIICLKADICVDKKSISINAALGVLIEDIENKQIFQSHASNYAKIPDISTKLALV